MTDVHPRESARILQFPTERLRKSHAQHDDVRAMSERRAARAPTIATGGAWYHDAAIQEAKRARER